MVTLLTAAIVILVVTVSNVVLLLPFGIAFFTSDDDITRVEPQKVKKTLLNSLIWPKLSGQEPQGDPLVDH